MSHPRQTTKNAIIEELWRSKKLATAIGKMQPEHLRDDLRSEIFAALCELPEERLVQMRDAGFLLFYTIRMMLNMIKSDRSTFHKKFRRSDLELFEENVERIDEMYASDSFPDHYLAAVTDIDQWDKIILEAYVEHGTYEEVSRVTGLDVQVLYRMLQNARARIISTIETHKQMEVIISLPIRINVMKRLDDEQIQTMVAAYTDNFRRQIRQMRWRDHDSMIDRPDRICPEITKIIRHDWNYDKRSVRGGIQLRHDKGDSMAPEIPFT